MPPTGFHHVEIWVEDLRAVEASWAWLLGQLGWELYQNWPEGRSWRNGDAYLVVEQSSAVRPGLPYDRLRPGLNHVAVHAPDETTVDRIQALGPAHGWQQPVRRRLPARRGTGALRGLPHRRRRLRGRGGGAVRRRDRAAWAERGRRSGLIRRIDHRVDHPRVGAREPARARYRPPHAQRAEEG